MKKLLPIVALMRPAMVIVHARMYLGDGIGEPRMQPLILAGTILWFVSAPFWMG